MREIKFRAWITEDRYMGEVTSLQMGDGAYVRTTGETPYCKLYEIELMQYTGLKDKTGKDGYAGDLVKMFDRSLFRIVWDDYYARFQLELVKGDEFTKVHDMGMLQFGEIIGNIHSNPELLTK